MAALAAMDERPVVRTAAGPISRGAASAVDLLSRLRGPLPEAEVVERPAERWARVDVDPFEDRLVVFRLELEAARRAGVKFEDAWRLAQYRAFASLGERGISGRKEQQAFITATNATRREWRRAYCYEGERLGIVDALMTVLEDDEDARHGLRVVDPDEYASGV